MNAHLLPTGSPYFTAPETQQPERHTLSVLVDNEPGILARVVGLFSARGYNIDSLTVSETEHEKGLSRITVVTVASGLPFMSVVRNNNWVALMDWGIRPSNASSTSRERNTVPGAACWKPAGGW